MRLKGILKTANRRGSDYYTELKSADLCYLLFASALFATLKPEISPTNRQTKSSEKTCDIQFSAR